jgi:TonB family protein
MKGVSPRASPSVAKDDYQWLWTAILRRMVEETNGEVCYQVDAVEGRVRMKIVIDEVGRISNIQIMQTSGYTILDQSTVDILQRISPVPLPQPLGKPYVTLQFPMTYRLNAQSQGPMYCSRVNG